MGEEVRLFMSGFDTINISLLTKLGRYTKHMPHRHTQTQLSFPKSIFHVNEKFKLQLATESGIVIRGYIEYSS